MKRVLLSICFITLAVLPALAQNKKAIRDSIAQVKFQKVVDAVNSKDFVIIADTYIKAGGMSEMNTDKANFISYEKEFVFLQGEITSGNNYTNKLTVSEYSQVADKKGNIRITMQVRGNFISGKIEISLKKGFPADVIVTPNKGEIIRFSGEVVPRAKSEYFKRSGEI